MILPEKRIILAGLCNLTHSIRKKLIVLILFAFCVLPATAQVKQSNLVMACNAMAQKNWSEGERYGLLSWQLQQLPYTAYLLAYAYYELSDAPNSVKFAQLALAKSENNEHNIFNELQMRQIKFIINPQIEFPDNHTESRKTLIFIKFGLDFNSPTGPRTLADVMSASTTPQKITPELVRAYQNRKTQDDMFLPPANYRLPVSSSAGLRDSILSSWDQNQYVVAYIDSTRKDPKIGYIYLQVKYDQGAYPELYSKKPFLEDSFIKLYIGFKNHGLDASDSLVVRYGLNRYNFVNFIEEVFPDIYSHREDLASYSKQLEWSAPPDSQ